MIWQTWRQHRAEASVAAFIVAVLVVAMIVVGRIARDRASSLGLPACMTAHKDCSAELDKLHQLFHSIPPFTGALIAIPLLAGMFWAAPLVSREYENGTHRLAWTQSVSPRRWITTKVALIFAVLATAALGLALLATWALDPLEPAFGGRYNSTWYDIQGIVPVACMLFALSVGVAASALIRRTIPAMAVTLFVYAAARIPVHWIRPHFVPAASRTVTIPASTVLQDGLGDPQDLLATALSPTDWRLSLTVTDSAGHGISTSRGNLGILQHFCANVAPNANGDINVPSSCRATLQAAKVRETIRYQPASHFWLIQAVETAIFVGLAAVLVGLTIYAVTRRRPS
jgi:hypothetical protein